MHPLSHSHCGCSSGASTSASACAPLRPPPFCRRRHRFSQPAAQKSAAGGGGEEDDQLWFVTKFEERRRREEEERRQREADAQLAAAAGDEPLATNEQPPPPPPPPAPKATPPAAWTRAAALQSAQLAAGLAALILLPAALHPGGLFVGRVWLLYLAYFAFFAGGTVRRILEHGPLAAASTDRQRADAGGRAALAAFVTMMPVVHWLPLRRYLARLDATPFDQAMAAAAAGPALYDVAGAALVAAAVALNWRAAAALGRAYDRVVAPQRLVTAGPYALVQVGGWASVAACHGLRQERRAGAALASVACLCVSYSPQTTHSHPLPLESPREPTKPRSTQSTAPTCCCSAASPCSATRHPLRCWRCGSVPSTTGGGPGWSRRCCKRRLGTAMTSTGGGRPSCLCPG
jgi:hypothetical protein